MGQLAGFKYRDIIRRLKKLGFVFDRHAAGSHEIWFNPVTNRYTTIPNHAGRQVSQLPSFWMPENSHGQPTTRPERRNPFPTTPGSPRGPSGIRPRRHHRLR
ncbi:MAG: hypothetical protein DCC51_12860 [Anaerolineae bacterium]|nr:MAG: hypothetical protein DCC51_12860 [Anaerolineae bacterium]